MTITKMMLQRVGIVAILAPCISGVSAQDREGVQEDRISLSYGQDPNIKVLLKGRAGNIELQRSETDGAGYILTDYQKGSGYVDYDRQSQVLKSESKITYTLNRLSKHIQKVAPYTRAFIPRGAELDFTLNITNLGYGTMDFSDLNINHFKCDVNYGDVDVSFPTENRSIVRGAAKFHVMAGDLEVYQLGNLKAGKVKINGGAGEVTVDFGPKIYRDTEVRIDLDIGTLELIIPRGTLALISGTSRDLSAFEFKESGKQWAPASYHRDSPTLNIKLKGPMGSLNIVWK